MGISDAIFMILHLYFVISKAHIEDIVHAHQYYHQKTHCVSGIIK